MFLFSKLSFKFVTISVVPAHEQTFFRCVYSSVKRVRKVKAIEHARQKPQIKRNVTKMY